LGNFLIEVRAWLAADPSVAVESREYPLDDPFGRYTAPGLEVFLSGQRVASIVPVAGVVIGAEGRVDVKGPLDEAAALYLSGPGSVGVTLNGVSALSNDLFAGFSRPGWYWMLPGSSPNREVRRVDAAIFRAMVESVSDVKILPAR
jgi:hypothetical protein